MARMTWLASALRAAGLSVVEYLGWQSRGKDGGSYSMRPKVVIVHHTATHWTTPDPVVTKLLVNGRSDLPGPLCHLGLNRTGQFIVIAAGKANHAGTGFWQDANESVETIGIEAYNYGNSIPFPTREPWPQTQLDAYDRGVAAILKYLGRDYRSLCAHREWAIPAGRKPDPSGIDMNLMRQRVADLMEDEMVLREGATGPAVKLAQKAYNVWQQSSAAPAPIAEDGVYGQATTVAVRAYQTAAGLSGTGNLDGVTAAYLLRYV